MDLVKSEQNEQRVKVLVTHYLTRVNDYATAKRSLRRILHTVYTLSDNNEAAVAGQNMYGAWGDFKIDAIPCGYFIWGDCAEVWFGSEDLFLKLGCDNEKAGYFWNGEIIEWQPLPENTDV